MNNRTSNEKITVRDILGRLVMFILCGAVILIIYFITAAPLYGIITGIVESGEEPPENITFILYTVLYIIPLYVMIFLRDIGLKTEILHITAEGYDVKKVFAAVYRSRGWLDHAIYACYSLLMLIPFSEDPFENPFSFVSTQEMVFYSFPIPRLLSWLLSVLCFAVQYALCLLIVSSWWNKKRLHRGGEQQ